MDYGLHTLKCPNGKWKFVGGVPMSLAYEKSDGSQLTPEEAEDLARSSNPAMTQKARGIVTRVFETEEEAIADAKERGFSVTSDSKYKYRMTMTGASSAKYGDCEICHEHVSEVYHQVESVEYAPGRFTHALCHNLFGHRDCLVGRRK